MSHTPCRRRWVQPGRTWVQRDRLLTATGHKPHRTRTGLLTAGRPSTTALAQGSIRADAPAANRQVAQGHVAQVAVVLSASLTQSGPPAPCGACSIWRRLRSALASLVVGHLGHDIGDLPGAPEVPRRWFPVSSTVSCSTAAISVFVSVTPPSIASSWASAIGWLMYGLVGVRRRWFGASAPRRFARRTAAIRSSSCPFRPSMNVAYQCLEKSPTFVARTNLAASAPSAMAAKCFASAGDLGGLAVAQRIVEQGALGLDDEVQAVGAARVHHHGPVRVVVAQRRRHVEPARQLRVQLHRGVLLQLPPRSLRSVSES